MKYTIFLISFLGLLSCHSNDAGSELVYSGDYVYEDVEIEEEDGGVIYRENHPPMTAELSDLHQNDLPQNEKQGYKDQPPMIIRHGEMSIEVQDLSTAKSSIDSLLSKYESYYQREDFNSGYSSSNYRLVIRVPRRAFDDVIQGLEGGIGKVKSKEIGADDITEEYVDLQLRLENNMEYLKRYIKLLDQADSIKDMIVIQEKVRRLEEEIESKKGRVRYLKNKVSFSTLQLMVIQEHPTVASADDDYFGKEIASAFVSGYNGALSFILIMVSIWPFLILLFLIIWAGRKYFRVKKIPNQLSQT